MWSFGTTMTMAHDKKEPDAPSSSSSQPPAAAPPAAAAQPTADTLVAVTPPDATQHALSRPSVFSQRSMKQLGLYFAGAGFLSLATLITRRSIARKRIATMPSFYQPSNRPVSTNGSDGGLIALEALSLATLNVMGFGIMCTGGLAWAFDISSIDDLRKMARGHIGPTGGFTDEEAEREIEEWVAKVLGRKEKGEEDEATSPKKGA